MTQFENNTNMKIVSLNVEARQKLISGVNKVCDAVKLTLGPFGFNAILGREYKNPTVTNDGVTIAGEIEFEDEIENLGAQVIQSVSNNADKSAGDGTTTAMVLAQKIIATGFKALSSDALIKKSAMSIRREIETAKDAVVSRIKELSKPVESEEDLKNVAFTALEDKHLAETLTAVVQEVGKNGLITVEDASGYDTTYRIEKGLELPFGFNSPYMEDKDGKAAIQNPHFLVTNYKINDITDISALTTRLAQSNVYNLVIIADGFSNSVISTLIHNKFEGQFNVIGISCNNTEDLNDIALITGANLVDVMKNQNLADAGIEQLGTSERVIVTKDSTIIVGAGNDVSERVAQLNEKILTATSEYEKQRLLKRLSGLDKGMGIIEVGASSAEEREYIKLKLEDGIHAVHSAMEMGVVRGGGLTFKQIAEESDSILKDALLAPYNQIQENAGGNLEIGLDVIDPAKTIINALESAVSVSGILLTTAIAITQKNVRNP